MLKLKGKLLVSLSIVTLLLLSSVSGAYITNNDPSYIVTDSGNKKWTIMYYLCLDNNHTDYELELISNDLMEIGSTDDLNIMLLGDGENDDDTVLYYIEEGSVVELNDMYGWPDEVDMSNPVTLKSFINLVMNHYPADHYALFILSDQGSGWQGILHDDKSPLMSIPDFADVLKDVTNDGEEKIDVIGFMPCVNGMLEVIYEISSYVDYAVISEEHMLEPLDKGPEYIFPYFESTWNLKNNTDMTPEDFACSVVDYYNPCSFKLFVFYIYLVITFKNKAGIFLRTLSNVLTKIFNSLPNPEFHNVELLTTLSAINTSKLNDLKDAIDELSSLLILNINDKNVVNSIKSARNQVREYGKSYPKNKRVAKLAFMFSIEKYAFDSFIDLYHLIELINESVENQVIKDACNNVIEKFNEAVLANNVMPEDNSHGMSIYFPKSRELYNKHIWEYSKGREELPNLYEELQFSEDTLWDEFLKEYLEV